MATAKLFAADLDSPILRFNLVRNKMFTNPTLRRLATIKTKVKTVVDHVHYLQKKRRDEKTTTAPKEAQPKSQFDFEDYSTKSTSEGRRFWDEQDSLLVENAFKDVVAVPKRAEIKAVFMKDVDLQEIWSSEGANRCYDKVKSIIRKRLRKSKHTSRAERQ